jgi:hypothetical protein
MTHITLQVSSHPWRCIEEDGTRCQWLRVSRMGSVYSCHLFSEQTDRGDLIALREQDGCLVKHDECTKQSEAGINAELLWQGLDQLRVDLGHQKPGTCPACDHSIEVLEHLVKKSVGNQGKT